MSIDVHEWPGGYWFWLTEDEARDAVARPTDAHAVNYAAVGRTISITAEINGEVVTRRYRDGKEVSNGE